MRKITLVMIALMACILGMAQNKVAKAERAAQTFTVNSIDELMTTVKSGNFHDGDIVKFREGLRGTVLENTFPEDGFEIEKSLTIIGNGVIIGPGPGLAQYLESGDLIVKDVVFRGINDAAIYTNGCNLTVEGCVFEGCNALSSSYMGAVVLEKDSKGEEFVCNISHCRFSDNKFNKVIYIKGHPAEKDQVGMRINITSCTFTGNTTKNGTIYVTNLPTVRFTNNVFEGETTTTGTTPIINLTDNSETAAQKVCSGGYNVIEGAVSNSDRLTETDIIGEELDPILQFDEGEYKVIKGGLAYYRVNQQVQVGCKVSYNV